MEKKILFVYYVNIEEALGWNLHKESLRSALIDAAEEAASFDEEVECSGEVTIKENEFVISFKEPT
jgi:hypothetical protein